jgi:hypothetical protein
MTQDIGKNDTRRIFRQKGMCSHTFYHILNREFGHHDTDFERASDPLVGGIMQFGYQCGLLFGTSLAVGNECYRRFTDPGTATAMAIVASKNVSDAFEKNAGSVNCRDITDTDFQSKLQMARYLIFKARSCFTLADKWTEDAINSAKEGLAGPIPEFREPPISCASEVVRMIGANEEESMIVAGFAGGIGLTGEACGALSAAIWYRSLQWCRENPKKSSFNNPYASDLLFTFDEATGSKFLCRDICGRGFKTIDEHTEYIRSGGCEKLIKALSGPI